MSSNRARCSASILSSCAWCTSITLRMPLPRANVSDGVTAGSACMNTLIRRAPCSSASTPANSKMPAVSVRPSMKTTISPNLAAPLSVFQGAGSGSGDHVDCLLAIATPPSRRAFTHVGHHLKGNSPALVLGQHETLRGLGVLDRLQQPVQLFSIHDVLLSSQLTIRLFSLDVAHDVPGVTTGGDEFRASFGQLGERLLPALVDEGHACEVHHALAFPASGFCFRPVGLQF